MSTSNIQIDVLDNKGHIKTLFVEDVNTSYISPQQEMKKLIQQYMLIQLNQITEACQSIGHTDGQGGGNAPTDGLGINNPLTSSGTPGAGDTNDINQDISNWEKKLEEAENALKKAEASGDNKAILQALQNLKQISEAAKTAITNDVNALNNEGKTLTPSQQQAVQKLESECDNNLKQIAPELKDAIHKYIENTPLGELLYQFLMKNSDNGALVNSLITTYEGALGSWNVQGEDLGKALNAVSKLTQDFSDLANLPDFSDKTAYPNGPSQKDLERVADILKDIEAQLKILSTEIGPDSHINSTTKGDLSKLASDITSEFTGDTGTNMDALIKQLQSGSGYDTFHKFYAQMVNESGTATKSGPQGIYTELTGASTELSTQNSTVMAKVNLFTQQISEVEKLWSSVVTTIKTLFQSETGNIAN